VDLVAELAVQDLQRIAVIGQEALAVRVVERRTVRPREPLRGALRDHLSGDGRASVLVEVALGRVARVIADNDVRSGAGIGELAQSGEQLSGRTTKPLERAVRHRTHLVVERIGVEVATLKRRKLDSHKAGHPRTQPS
jgi:hypothetical protein